MPRYALLLRGVNVGKGNQLPMADLRAMLERLGCVDVATYVQSGNAVVRSVQGRAALLAAVEAALARAMGRPIAVIARSAAELADVVATNPFADVARRDDARKHLCVTFLARAAPAAALAPLVEPDFAPERVHVVGAHIYSWHPDGQGRSPLAAALGKLRVTGAVTTRNWNTVRALHDLLVGGAP